ncbi:MAG TPA: hypothetical protein VFG21_04350 [Xanthomonadaceae bacterium]|nr:hypothetical protein [Xanthomonadaceae bacterium]
MVLTLDTQALDALRRGQFYRLSRSTLPSARTLRRLGFRPGLCTPPLPAAAGRPPRRDAEIAPDWQPL